MEILKYEILHNNYCQQHHHAAVLSLLNVFILGHSCHIWYRCIYIYIYIFVYVFVKLTIFFLFFVTFKCNVFSALHAKHFEIWKNILWNWWVDYFILRPMEWCDDGCSEWIYFPFYEVFFSQENFLWSPCLLLITESISLDNFGKPTVAFFLNITFPSWIILSISIDELNFNRLQLKSWWWIFLKIFFFYCCKRILIWQKILEVFCRIYLSCCFWIKSWWWIYQYIFFKFECYFE